MTTVQPRNLQEPVPDGAAPVKTNESHDGSAVTGSHLQGPGTGPEPQPGRKSHAWIWVLLVLIAGSGGGYYLVQHYQLLAPKAAAGKKGGDRPIPVVTAKVKKGDVNLYLSSLGTVTAFQTVTVRSRVDGEIMKVLYTEGQLVKEGDPLVEVDSRAYEVQLSQAQGQLAKDQASLTQAKLDLGRDQKLAAAKAVSPQVLDAQISLVGQLEGAIKTDQAMIDNAKLQIDYCHITAPITGRIGLRLVDRGNLVQAASATILAVITQLQPIAVVFTVPQDDVFRVQQKFAGGEQVPVEAWNRDFATKLASGRLLAIDNQVDMTTGTVKLKAVFQNEDNLLFPNEFVNSKLLIDTQRNVVIVPSSAIQRGPNSTFAYIVKKDAKDPKVDTVELKNLKLGETEGDQTIVESGLAAGDIVVTEGTDKLQSNKSKVSVRSPRAGKGKKKGGSQPGDGQDSGTSGAAPTAGGPSDPNATAAEENRVNGGDQSARNQAAQNQDGAGQKTDSIKSDQSDPEPARKTASKASQ